MSNVINTIGALHYWVTEASFIQNKLSSSIYSNSTVSIIHSGMFQDCSNLTTLNLPNVHTIQNNAFQGCTGLTQIILPNTYIIGDNAFQGCTNLKLAVIFDPNKTQPSEAPSFGATAFSGCTILSTLYLGLDIPPTLPSSTVFSGTKLWGASANGKIYVPDAAVYKASAVWKLGSFSNKIVTSAYSGSYYFN